jgi:hypothetical protein
MVAPGKGISIGTFYPKSSLDKIEELMDKFPRAQFPSLRRGSVLTAIVAIGLEADDIYEKIVAYLEKEVPDKNVQKAATLISSMTQEQKEILKRQLLEIEASENGKNVPEGDLLSA